jgi:hypothetical protein
MAVLTMPTFLTAWNDFFWPIIALSTQNLTVQVSFQTRCGHAPQQSIIAAGTILRNSADPGSSSPCSAGRSSAGSCKERSRDDTPRPRPPRSSLALRRDSSWAPATGGLPDRSGVAATAAPRRFGTRPSATLPARSSATTTGDVACDHYHLVRRWGTPTRTGSPRRTGSGAARSQHRQPGRLTSTRLGNGRRAPGARHRVRRISPSTTGISQELQDAGGWASRDTAYRFAGVRHPVPASSSGDRVATWITLNVPRCSSYRLLERRAHAPGHTNAR